MLIAPVVAFRLPADEAVTALPLLNESVPVSVTSPVSVTVVVPSVPALSVPAIVDVHGALTGSAASELLQMTARAHVGNGSRVLILNLADVPYIDSAGLGEIVRTYTTVSRQGGSLKLLNLTKRITDLLSITKLLTVFETFDAEADAVKSFTASAKV